VIFAETTIRLKAIYQKRKLERAIYQKAKGQGLHAARRFRLVVRSDGWWMEGLIEGVTGWGIGDEKRRQREDEKSDLRDTASLYDKLQRGIIPMFHTDRDRFVDHASCHRGERFFLQHPKNAPTIPAECVLPLTERCLRHHKVAERAT